MLTVFALKKIFLLHLNIFFCFFFRLLVSAISRSLYIYVSRYCVDLATPDSGSASSGYLSQSATNLSVGRLCCELCEVDNKNSSSSYCLPTPMLQ